MKTKNIETYINQKKATSDLWRACYRQLLTCTEIAASDNDSRRKHAMLADRYASSCNSFISVAHWIACDLGLAQILPDSRVSYACPFRVTPSDWTKHLVESGQLQLKGVNL